MSVSILHPRFDRRAAGSSAPVLMPAVLARLEAARPAQTQVRVWRRFELLCMGLMLAMGRHTLAQMLVALGVTGTGWSGWYQLLNQGRITLERLNEQVLADGVALREEGEPVVLVVDSTQVPRSSNRFPGVGLGRQPRTPVWQPGSHLMQRWCGVSVLVAERARGVSRAIPVWWGLARSERSAPMGETPVRSEVTTVLAGIVWVCAQLPAAARQKPVLVLGDGAYGNARMLNGLPAEVALLARVARSRRLWQMPAPREGVGRPRRYGAQGPLAEERRHQHGVRWQRIQIMVRGVWREGTVDVSGPWLLQGAPDHPVMLLTVRGKHATAGHRREVRGDLLVVSAVQDADGPWTLPLPVDQLLGWYWQRWEVEVMHRELKTTFGLGDQQAWSQTAAALTQPWVVAVYATLLLVGCQQWGLGVGPLPAHTGWHRPVRFSFATLWQAYRQEVWTTAEFQPTWARSPDPWGKMTAWIDTIWSASLGIRHI